MFNSFGTELALWGVVEIVEIEPIQELYGNKNIRIKAQTTRRRVDKIGNLVQDHDIVYLKLWANGAEYIADNASAGDMMLVRGEVRGKAPNIDLRVKSFELLTPSEEALSLLNAE